MFALLALLCFLVSLFGGTLGGIDLVTLGLAFIAASMLVGNWPMGYVTTRFNNTRA
jgi:hypothetical protein